MPAPCLRCDLDGRTIRTQGDARTDAFGQYVLCPHGLYREPASPTRADLPPIIAHRYACPSCRAAAGEPCRLNGAFTQDYSHVARHKIAQSAMWESMTRLDGIAAYPGWTVAR